MNTWSLTITIFITVIFTAAFILLAPVSASASAARGTFTLSLNSLESRELFHLDLP